MTERSAVDTIRGYFYQFDMTILRLLQLASLDDSIEIECIEDIDIRTATDVTAVQCKYYAKTEYNHSVIKDAVMWMLSHFKESKAGTKPKILYIIQGHYASGQDKLDDSFDIEFLKKHFLTYTKDKITHHHHNELGLSDADLEEFLTRLTIDIRAMEFDAQFREIIRCLEVVFKCRPFSAEYFYYNNALAIIRELSIKPAAAHRTITKRALLAKIDTSSVLFNEWFIQKNGKKAHLTALRKEYFTEFNVSPFERFFLVETDVRSYVRADLKELLFTISKKWSKLTKIEPTPFCPYVYIHGIPSGELVELKKELNIEGLKLIDGHDFQGADFSCHSIKQKATHGNGIKIKVLNTLADLQETVDSIATTRRIYQFYLGSGYFTYDNAAVRHVKIQVEALADVKLII
jgi:hypothetical protein